MATSSDEAARLEDLLLNGVANGLAGLRLLDRAAMREIEPHAGGVRALHVPSTGITDYAAVAAKYAEIAKGRGTEIKNWRASLRLRSFAGRLGRDSPHKNARRRFFGALCRELRGTLQRSGGANGGGRIPMMIVPFRGEYYELSPARRDLVKALIYPVPDSRYPFLGVHFTRRIHGGVDAGPNAVLAFRREGYRSTDFDFADTFELARYKGFRAMAGQHWKNGLAEFRRSLRKRDFVRSCRRLLPEVQMEDMTRGGSGVRAQAVGPHGELVDDFHFVKRERFLHVLNVPSPAATASLPIGREILKMLPEEIVK